MEWRPRRGGGEGPAPRAGGRGRRWSAVAAQLPGGGRPAGAGGARRPSQTFFVLVAGPGSLVLRDRGPSRGVRGPPGSVPAASRSRPSRPGCGPRGSRQTQPRVRTRIRGDGSPPPLRASPRATQSGTVLTARVGGQAGDKLSRRPWPWALRPPHAPQTPCPAASRPNLRPDRAVRGHSVRGHCSVPVPLLPPRSPRGHGGAPFRPRGRSHQDAPRSPAGRTPRPRPGPHAAAARPRPWEDAASRPGSRPPLSSQPGAKPKRPPARAARCSAEPRGPRGPSGKAGPPSGPGAPRSAVESELPLAARHQPFPTTRGGQWSRAAPRVMGAGFSWPRPAPEPQPPTRLCWARRGRPLVYGACERSPFASACVLGRSSLVSIYVTVLKTDETSIAPSGAFGDCRQNNLKDLLNIF